MTTNVVNTDIAYRLRSERQRLEISQTALAQKAGVSRATQVNYESGKRLPDTPYLLAVSALGVDVFYLLTGQRREDDLQRLAAAGYLADRAGEELLLGALANIALEEFEADITDEDIEAAKQHELTPMLRKVIEHTWDLKALFDTRPAVDVGILELVLAQIEQSDIARRLGPAKKARVAALAYRLDLKDGVVDSEIVREAASLALQ
jgi:transcriptional regulator with XRE-family HTH domain